MGGEWGEEGIGEWVRFCYSSNVQHAVRECGYNTGHTHTNREGDRF